MVQSHYWTGYGLSATYLPTADVRVYMYSDHSLINHVYATHSLLIFAIPAQAPPFLSANKAQLGDGIPREKATSYGAMCQ